MNWWSCFVIPFDSKRGEHSTEFYAVVFVALYLILTLFHNETISRHSSRYPFISPLIEFYLRPLFKYKVVNSPKENTHLLKTVSRMRSLERRKDQSARNKITSRSYEIKRSSQLRTLLKQVVENRTWKKFRPVRNLNPWPQRYRCSALPTELTSQLAAGQCVGSK